jgi:hypothetical protein
VENGTRCCTCRRCTCRRRQGELLCYAPSQFGFAGRNRRKWPSRPGRRAIKVSNGVLSPPQFYASPKKSSLAFARVLFFDMHAQTAVPSARRPDTPADTQKDPPRGDMGVGYAQGKRNPL